MQHLDDMDVGAVPVNSTAPPANCPQSHHSSLGARFDPHDPNSPCGTAVNLDSSEEI